MENIPKIHKFRNIQLIKHDFNFLLSLIWAQKLPNFFKNTNYYKKQKKGAENDEVLMKCFSIKYNHMTFVE